MSIALERIRTELGTDAVVLESRTIRAGFLWMKPTIEVVASDETGSANSRSRRPSATVSSSPQVPTPSSSDPLPTGPVTGAATPDGTMAWPTLMSRLNSAADASPLRPLWSMLQHQDVDNKLALEVVMAA